MRLANLLLNVGTATRCPASAATSVYFEEFHSEDIDVVATTGKEFTNN